MTELTTEDLKDYLREDEDSGMLSAVLDAAKQYVSTFTGLTMQECDEYEDLNIACLAVAADLYDNRTATMSTSAIVRENPVVAQILGAYSVNLLGGGTE